MYVWKVYYMYIGEFTDSMFLENLIVKTRNLIPTKDTHLIGLFTENWSNFVFWALRIWESLLSLLNFTTESWLHSSFAIIYTELKI